VLFYPKAENKPPLESYTWPNSTQQTIQKHHININAFEYRGIIVVNRFRQKVIPNKNKSIIDEIIA
jgi:hypothetical protein